MKKLKRHLFGVASMVLGGGAALGAVFTMNSFSQAPRSEERSLTSDFNVEKEKPPPRERPKPRTPPRQVKTSSAPRAPLPDLGSSIAGVSFDLPGFDSANLGRLGDRLLGDMSKHTVMTADVVDNPPKPRARTAPDYPAKARQRGITGYVTLKLKVTAGGQVDSVRVVESNPRGVFEESAIASVRQWQFDPGVYQGTPVDTWVNQTLRFELN